MKNDSAIKHDVEEELRWEPEVDDTDIAIKIHNGVATLTGFVSSYAQKYRAANAAKRVAGVMALANDIEVRLTPGEGVSDPQLARDAVAALKAELPRSWEEIKPTVQNGKVALEGTVEWHYQRERAEQAMHNLRGVVSVRNSIRVKPRVVVTDGLKDKIAAAFRRNAQIDADSISIEEHHGEITLRGKVHSWAEREQAYSTAWSAPGVTYVSNEINVVS
jgi:osmotically-inducible protein OsmY